MVLPGRLGVVGSDGRVNYHRRRSGAIEPERGMMVTGVRETSVAEVLDPCRCGCRVVLILPFPDQTVLPPGLPGHISRRFPLTERHSRRYLP